MTTEAPVDLLIVGGGIVGLACAHTALGRHPGSRVLLLEKEPGLAAHQTGRNSGVIHSGLYYPPRSQKARMCREGREALLAFCADEQIPYELCGKLVIATREDELPGLAALLARGEANGVACTRLDRKEIRTVEPHADGLAAIHVPEAGIVDYREVARGLARRIETAGGTIRRGCHVRRLAACADGTIVAEASGDRGSTETIRARRAIACAGLQADLLAQNSGLPTPVRIVPFRGEYHQLRTEAAEKVRGLIYPVPDPRYPFLGVHLTRHLDGRVRAGPNAVLAWAREGYAKGAFSTRDALAYLRNPGLRRLVRQNLAMGLREAYRSRSRRRFARDAARLLPGLTLGDLIAGTAADHGIRAQALFPDGRLADDFVLVRDQAAPIVHVLNAPSPAATASLAIAAHLVDAVDAADTIDAS